ncbi:MAG: polysaccharide pyruvyl transferase family protein [Candidatus Bathyarchaeia archaeon]
MEVDNGVRAHIIGNLNPLNSGWRILLISVTTFLSRKFPNIEFTKESLFPQIDEKLNPMCKCTKSMKSSIILLISTFVRAIFWRLFRLLGLDATALFNEPLRQYYDADVIIDLSGDGLCLPKSKSHWYSLAKIFFKLANLISILIAILLNKKVILYSASVGGLGVLVPLAKLVLNKVDLIVVRDYESLEYLNRIKVTKPTVYFAPDAAFSMRLNKIGKRSANGSAPVIGFNLSTEAVWHFHKIEFQYFARLIGSLVNYISENLGATAILIPSSLGGPFRHDDDRIILNEVLKYVGGKNISVIGTSDLSLIIDAISKCDVLVTMRMHPAIISLLCGTPPLMISHSPKFHGLMKLIGLENLLYVSTKIDYESLKKQFLYIWENRNLIRAHIEGRIGSLIELSLNGLERLASAIHEITKTSTLN